MGVYAMLHEFKPSESNAYNDYFSSVESTWELRSLGKTVNDVYKEHLETASKEKLISIALEGHEKYSLANALAYERGLEIEKLNTTIAELNNTISTYETNLKNTYIGVGIFVSLIIIIAASKIGLNKLKKKIRKEITDEINGNPVKTK